MDENKIPTHKAERTYRHTPGSVQGLYLSRWKNAIVHQSQTDRAIDTLTRWGRPSWLQCKKWDQPTGRMQIAARGTTSLRNTSPSVMLSWGYLLRGGVLCAGFHSCSFANAFVYCPGWRWRSSAGSVLQPSYLFWGRPPSECCTQIVAKRS